MDIRHISTITNDELHCFTPLIIIDCTLDTFSVTCTTIQTITIQGNFYPEEINKSINDKLNITLAIAIQHFRDYFNEETLFFRQQL